MTVTLVWDGDEQVNLGNNVPSSIRPQFSPSYRRKPALIGKAARGLLDA